MFSTRTRSVTSTPPVDPIVRGESSTSANPLEPPRPEQAAQTRRRDSVPPWLDLSAKTLAVDGNATVPDLLKLIWRSDPRAGKDYIACEMRSGIPHLSLVKSEKVAARSAGASRNAVAQILDNTIAQYEMPDHVRDDIAEFAEEIRQSLNTESEPSESEPSESEPSEREPSEREPSEREPSERESTELSPQREPSERGSTLFDTFDEIGLEPLEIRLPESASTERSSTERGSSEPAQTMPLRKDMFGPLAAAFSHVEHAATIGPKEKLPSLLALTPVKLPGKALVVDGTTALPDLLQLIARSDPKAGKDYFACDMRSGIPHLSLVKSQETAERSNDPCINALLQILNNTIDRYELTDAMTNEVNELRTQTRKFFSTGPGLWHLPLNKNAFGPLAQLMIGSSGDPRETPRMPADCLMNLISALDRVALPDEAGAGDALIARVLHDAKREMLAHPTIDRAREFFDAISRDFTAEGLGDLAKLSERFARDMDRLTDRGRLTQRLAERPATIVLSYIDQLNINQLRSDARVQDTDDEQGEELEILPEDHHAPVRDTAAEREQLKTLVEDAKKKAKAGVITPQEASGFFTAVRNYFLGHGPASEVDQVDECIARLGASERSRREVARLSRSPDGNPGTLASAARPWSDEQKIEGFFYTKMNENLYGRALDTFIIRALRDNPPTPMKERVEALGRALAEKLGHDWFTYHDFQNFVSTQRGRLPQVERVTDFIQAQDDAYAALKHALTAPVATGEDCMGVAYLAVMVAERLNWVNETLRNWADAATYFEESTIAHVDSIITHHDNHDDKKLVRHAGVALHYQPAAKEPADRPHARYMDQVKPDLENPSLALKTALQRGFPFATGVSRVTSRMTHIVAGLQMEGHGVDPAAIAAALSLHMAAEGRHSLHEVILGMELAKENVSHVQVGLRRGQDMSLVHLALNIGRSPRHAQRTRDGTRTGAMRERYASNYNNFLADLCRGEPGARESLEDTVWKQAIDYYRTHSQYEGATDGTT
jgi:hypothetical protein